MLHTVYLAGLCHRRNWSDPIYQVTATRGGYTCVVRVNNREYQTSKQFDNETAAKEAAALTAYTICRSFSVNDGMYPTGFDHSGVVQGRAVPVGAGRRHRNTSEVGHVYRYRGESDSSRSGGSSPDYSHEPRYVEVRGPGSVGTTYNTSYGSTNRSYASNRGYEPRYSSFTPARS